MTREVPVTQARADLAELVSRVGYSGERILLTRHGKALAALVPVSDLEELERPPAEIGFSIAPPAQPEPEPRERPERPTGPMRIAAEHREDKRPGWKR
ncbi:type II toxin-antitoxin system Phd/YefM family antitoxin [Actinomadura sp. DC4]|uniref:type II toxin-antitoxin system Phd/YefM family antitoxin n=1 Tax=Actinomadura sp. DC4 TaxID=3055069 RepID=UPI0025B22154|nr:type II toxin-antitoxin system Phd/YefM family antitoxin [Actinomadura sp. DC4]MDN3352391.1 type II toxin-antitoxin system Phd/YefM family antitoxin [Actinomadura sp. DC4]